jgi:probable HAF family extracellular repeat protein
MGSGKSNSIRITMSAIGAIAALCLHTASSHAQIPCHYEVTHIIQAPYCNPFGYPPTTAVAISPNGRYVVGSYNACVIGDHRAFVYDTTTGLFTTLPLPSGYTESSAEDVNDAGQIVGSMIDTTTGDKAFVYQDGQYIILPPPDGGAWSFAMAVNNIGIVCGHRSLADGGDPAHPWQAFVWSSKNGLTDLGVMNGPNSTAYAVSTNGIVVGYTGGTFSTSSDNARAFIYEDGIVSILPPVPNGINSVAVDLNNSGLVIVRGKMQQSPFVLHSFTYDGQEFHELLNPGDFDRQRTTRSMCQSC